MSNVLYTFAEPVQVVPFSNLKWGNLLYYIHFYDTCLMNTELETRFIQLLKSGLLDNLRFDEVPDRRVTGFSFCYDCHGHEFEASYGFRSEGDKIILILSYWRGCLKWGKYINLRRGLPNRTDILKVECGALPEFVK